MLPTADVFIDYADAHFAEVSLLIYILMCAALFSGWSLWSIWRSTNPLGFKVSYSLIALIPGFGPLALLWIRDFPESQPDEFRDRNRYQADVFDRWRDAIEEGKRRQRKKE